MATTQGTQHESNSSHGPQSSTSQPAGSGQASSGAPDGQNLPLVNLAQDQVLALLKTLPQLYRVQGDPKDSIAAEALSNMSQSSPQYHHMPPGMPMYQHYPGMDPGPSSHPRGPPGMGNVGQIPAGMQSNNAPPPSGVKSPIDAEGQQSARSDGQDGPPSSGTESEKPKSASGRRNGRSATMTNDEWTRQRKDNHKEVERRRRGNINEGINELGRIVPNGSGEKAKGAILSRAVSYIHHLKENEARNIEKWTLEKLLMDQAMGDLQAQLEEMKRMWEEERVARQRVESELEALKGIQGHSMANGSGETAPSAPAEAHGSATPDGNGTSSKRTIDDVDRESVPQGGGSAEGADDQAKRPRVE